MEASKHRDRIFVKRISRRRRRETRKSRVKNFRDVRNHGKSAVKKTRRFDNRGKLLWEIAFRSREVAAGNPVEYPRGKQKTRRVKRRRYFSSPSPRPRRKSNFAFTLNWRPKKKKINVVPGVDVNLFILVTRRFAIRLSSSLRWDRKFLPFSRRREFPFGFAL